MENVLKKISRREITVGITITLLVAALGGLFISQFEPVLIIGALLFGLACVFIYRTPWLGLLGITFFLPFERIGSYDLAGITIRASQILALILIVVWLVKGVINRRLKPVTNPLTVPLVIFLLINLVALTNAENIERSIMVFAFTLFTIAFSWIIPQYVTSQERLRKIIKILLITATLVSLFGLWQFFGDMIGLPTALTGLREHYTKIVFGFPRIQSTALEPLYFANFLLLPLALVYVLLLKQKDQPFSVKWLFPAFLLIGVNLVLTVSRGGYLGAAVILLLISIFYLKRIFNWKFLALFFLGVVLVWVVAVYALGYGDIFQLNLDTFIEHVTNAFSGPAYTERIETFEWAKQAWLDHPWIGIGPGQYGPYVAAHPYIEPTEGWKIVNNEFIELLAETGILGLASFILILIMLIARSIKAIVRSHNLFIKGVMVALLASLLGIIAQYQTFSILYIMHIWFVIGLMISAQNLILVKKTASSDQPPESQAEFVSASQKPPNRQAGFDPTSPGPTDNFSTKNNLKS